MRLLFITGDSLHSDSAFRLGAHLAMLTDVAPTVLAVVRRESDRGPVSEALNQFRAALLASLPAVETKVRVGRPAEEILREAEEGGYGLLIIGEQQWSSRTLRLFGTVVERVARLAPCPILIAKGEPRAILRILVCDSGAVAPTVLERLSDTGLLRLLGPATEVTVLHVMSQISAAPGVVGRELDADADELIREHAPEGVLLEHDVEVLERDGLHPQPKVRHGFVVDEILDEAHTGAYDLVVIGTHREQGWQRFLLDDIAREVTFQCDRSILILR
jgi:nucleotide-binding universal stress UspA family protein